MFSQLVGLVAYGLVSITGSEELNTLIIQMLNPMYEFFLNLGL